MAHNPHNQPEVAKANNRLNRGAAAYIRRPFTDIQPTRAPKSFDQKTTSIERSSRAKSRDLPLSLQDVTRSPRDTERVKPAAPRQKPSLVLHRSGFGAKMARKPIAVKRPRQRHTYALRGLLLAIILCGLGVVGNAWYISKIAKTHESVLAKTTEKKRDQYIPNEEVLPVNAQATYQVASDLPRLITIPKLQATARVQKIETKPDNELRAPSSVYDAGWYEGSSKPGEAGAVLINGHVTGPTKRGVFYSVANLRENDKIELERGDGTIVRYTVVKVETHEYEELEMTTLLQSVEPTRPGLNIITSTERFDVKANKFEKRFVVFAVQD